MRSVFYRLMLFATCFSCWTVPAVAQEQPKLHLVNVADVFSNLGSSVRIDQERISSLFGNNVPTRLLNIRELGISEAQENQVTRDGILNAIRNLNVQPSDTVVFYYAGHGGNDRNLQHYLELSCGQKLQFSEVQNAVNSKNPRLAVFLRDCCNSFQRSGMQSVGRGVEPARPPQTVTPLFDQLFFQPAGVIDIIAAELGAVALGDDFTKRCNGGCFTSSFCVVFTERRMDRQKSWEQIFDEVRTRTNKLAQDSWGAKQYPVFNRYFERISRSTLSDEIDLDNPVPDINPGISDFGDSVNSDGLSSRRSPSGGYPEGCCTSPPATRPCPPPTINSLQKRQIVIPKRILRWR